jgi:uncharacterized protein (DUF1330 family)
MGKAMSAYVIGSIEITDQQTFGEYTAQVGPVIERGGGQVVAIGPVVDALEGDAQPTAAVVLAFADVAAAHGWYTSPEYAAIRGLRQRSGRSSVLLVDGDA